MDADPHLPQVNGVVAGGEVFSDPAVKGDTFEVKLASLAWPQQWRDADPEQTLTVIQGRTEIGDLESTVALLEGDAVIAATTTEGPGVIDLILTAEQVKAITDYTALSVRVIAGRPEVTCCPGAGIAPVLTATFHDSSCGVLNGVTVRLCWSVVPFPAWRGIAVACGLRIRLELSCMGSSVSDFILTGVWSGGGCTVPFTDGILSSPQCAPLFLRFGFTGVAISGNCPCCTNTIASLQIDVTE